MTSSYASGVRGATCVLATGQIRYTPKTAYLLGVAAPRSFADVDRPARNEQRRAWILGWMHADLREAVHRARSSARLALLAVAALALIACGPACKPPSQPVPHYLGPVYEGTTCEAPPAPPHPERVR